MYWSRAKNILILMLIGLNVYLGVSLFVYNSDRGASAEADVNADLILRSRNIEVACNIPNTRGVATRLNFISDGYDKNSLVERLMGITIGLASGIADSPIIENGTKKLEILSRIEFSYTDTSPNDSVDMTKALKIEQYATNFLKDKRLLPKSYIIDRYISNPGKSVTVIYIEKYGSKFIFDNYLEATVTAKGIVKIRGSHRSIRKAEPVGDNTIMTARQVLLKNFTENDVKLITGIDVGYKVNSTGEHNIKASSEEPVWRIKIKGDDIHKYFNVFNGVEIK